MRARIAKLPPVVEPLTTTLVGAGGGLIADVLGVPLGWLIGSMVATAALCCLRARAGVPVGLRYAGQLAIGLSAGLSFTPALVAHVLTFAPYLVPAVVASIAIGIALSGLLVRFGGLDRTTAFFASMPGGVAEMSNLAERNGGEVAPVAVAQTLRIFLAVLTIPLLARWLGQHGRAPDLAPALLLAPGAMVAMVAAAMLTSHGLSRLRVPNAWLLGAMAVGAVVALATGIRFHVQGPVLAIAQILIGTSLGARLRRDAIRGQARLVPITIATTGLLLAGNLALGAAMALLTGTGLTTMTLSTAPGGLAEMSLTAVALKADVSLVTAFHLARTLIVALASVPLHASLARRSDRRRRRSETALPRL